LTHLNEGRDRHQFVPHFVELSGFGTGTTDGSSRFGLHMIAVPAKTSNCPKNRLQMLIQTASLTGCLID
jgi:hypothetical protein